MASIKGVIFDYGGTIDCCGDHWACVIRDAYGAANISLDLDTFCDAYVYAERELAKVPHIKPDHTFLDMMRIKARIELEYLVENHHFDATEVEDKGEQIAQYCYNHARECIEQARPTLDYLAARYLMVLVSNFYGNVAAVLADFDLLRYFPKIVESAVVGIRKPDPRIFGLGVEELNLRPEEVLVVGDSLSKDVIPAESLGCRTAWIVGRQWFREKALPERADSIKSLAELQLLY